MGGMSGLYVGLSGLQVSSNSLNTTANNLSNVNTTGYVRQQVVNKDKAYNFVGTTSGVTTGQRGMGVTIGTINHVRDIFLDAAYRRETGRQAFYERLYNSVYEIETQMGETDFISGIGFQTSFADLKAAMNEVAKAPTDQTSRSALVQSAVQFVDNAKNIYNGLTDYQRNLDREIINTVTRMNEIGESIMDINRRIQKIESGRVENAMDLRDARDLLLDELSSYAKISYSEDEVGVVTVLIEGVQFADNLSFSKIGLNQIPGTEFVEPVWTNLKDQPLYNLNNTISTEKNTDVGGLKGLLVARGSVTPTAYTLEEPDPADYRNGLADEDYIAAVNAHEQYKISSEISTLVNVLGNFDKLISNMVQAINDVLCPETTADAAITGTDVKGNPVTIPAGATILDSKNAPMAADGSMGIELFSRNFCERYQVVTGTDGNTYYVRNNVDGFGNRSDYSINNIYVNTSILQDYSKIPLMEQDGAASYARAQQLVELFSKDALHYNSGADGLTFEEFYETMVDDVAIVGSIYGSMEKNETTLAAQLDSERQEILGVSSDEELGNMIRYQQAYNAASRFINVESEMLESLINNLGVR